MQDPQEVLNRLRQKTALYTGANTLQSIEAFLSGYWFATSEHRYDISTCDQDILLLPNEFHDWVAYRLHFSSGNEGWCRMIYSITDSEKDAIEKFFNLYREFYNRQRHLVANLSDFDAIYRQTILKRNNYCFEAAEKEINNYPESISIITYTSDPGFFVYSDTNNIFPERTFYSNIESFEFYTGVQREMLMIIDESWNYGNKM